MNVAIKDIRSLKEVKLTLEGKLPKKKFRSKKEEG